MNAFRSMIVGAACAIVTPAAFADAPDALSVAARIGITPDALVICGFDATDAATMLSRLDAVSTMRETLAADQAAADAAAHTAAATAAQLLRGPDEEGLAAQHASNLAALASAQAEVQHELGLLFIVATAGFDEGAVEQLQDMASRPRLNMAPEFRCVSMPDAQWRDVSCALVAERRAERRGESLDDDSASLLAAVRATQAVEAAASALQSGLQTVEAEFAAE